MNNTTARYLYYKGASFSGNLVSDEALGNSGYFSTGQLLSIIRPNMYRPSIEDLINSFVTDTKGALKAKMEKAIEGDFYCWGVEDNVFPNVQVKAITSSVQSQVGLGLSDFEICFDRNAFTSKDVVRLNSETQIYILSEANVVGSGGGYTYTARIMGTDVNAYLPVTDYNGVDSRAVKLGTAYEKFSNGNPYFNRAFLTKYKVPIGIHRKSYAIDGSAMTREKMMVCYDRKTDQKVWWHEDLTKVFTDFDTEVNMMKLFSKSSVLPDGTCTQFTADGKPVLLGDGIYEQVKNSNYWQIPYFSLDALNQFIGQIVKVTSAGMMYKNDLIALCGYNAFTKVQKALAREAGNLPTAIYSDGLFIQKADWKDKYMASANPLKISYNFVQYDSNGTTIKFMLCPYFDDITLNPAIDPYTGFAEKSNEILLLNMYELDDDARMNIMNLYRSGNGIDRKMVVKYEDGMHSLLGKDGGKSQNSASSGLDGCKVHMLSHVGTVVHDTQTCGLLTIQDYGN